MDPYRRGAGIPVDRFREGLDIQFGYLEAGVRHEIARPVDPASLERSRVQIAALFTAARAALTDRLPGEGGAALVERDLGPLEKVWVDSLSKPFRCALPGILSPVDLDAVRRGVAERAARFQPRALRNEDLADPDRLKTLGVTELLKTVRESLYEATRLATRDLAPHEARFDDWTTRIETLLPKDDGALDPVDEARRAELEEKMRRAASRKASAPNPGPGTDLPATAAGGSSSGPSHPDRSPASPRRTLWVAVFTVAALIAGAWLLRRRRGSSSSPRTG
jgi:hypothetical protein